MKDLILAIDQGTTGTTVLLFDRRGSIRGRAYSEFTQHYPRPGWVEHDPEEVWTVTLSVIQKALEDAADRTGKGPGYRNYQPTRDFPRVATQRWPPDRPRHRLAGPPDRVALRGTQARGP